VKSSRKVLDIHEIVYASSFYKRTLRVGHKVIHEVPDGKLAEVDNAARRKLRFVEC
jgi:hypothetical protein